MTNEWIRTTAAFVAMGVFYLLMFLTVDAATGLPRSWTVWFAAGWPLVCLLATAGSLLTAKVVMWALGTYFNRAVPSIKEPTRASVETRDTERPRD